jgi:hypothetical protein
MKSSLAGVVGLAILVAAVCGGCASQGMVTPCCGEIATYQWAPNPKILDLPNTEGMGTVRVRLVASSPPAVTYWHEYGTADAKEVIAYLGLVEVARTQFEPGERGMIELKLPPGKYWLRLAGNSLTIKADKEGVLRTKRFPDREKIVPVEVIDRSTSTVTVDYSCMGYPPFAGI